MIDKKEFIETLTQFVKHEIALRGDIEYCQDAVKIEDARNGIIRIVDSHPTDEQQDIYRLKELSMMNEDMNFEPNRMKITRIARSYFE